MGAGMGGRSLDEGPTPYHHEERDEDGDTGMSALDVVSPSGSSGDVAERAPVARITLTLPQPVWDTLSSIAEEQGVNKTEAVRRAISAYLLLHEAVRDGDKIILQHRDGTAETIRVHY
jgi:hypothetical protein